MRNKVGSRQWAVDSGAPIVPRSPLNRDPALIEFSLPTAHCPLPTNQDGTILIALLWILVALSVIALSFSRETFVEVAAARNSQSLESAYFIARAGIDSTVYQLLKKRFTPRIDQPELQEAPDPLDLGLVTGNLGGGGYRVDVQDESGKINLNMIQEAQLRRLTEAAGINKRDGDIITDSILDWLDLDNDPRLNGAENDYYQTLNPPYKAKNGRIDTVEELLLIRGITPEYFYGHPERDANGAVVYKYGLSRYLTAYSNRNQVNVNFAPLPVLLSIPGMTLETAKLLYDRRHVKPYKTPTDLAKDLGVAVDPKVISSLAVDQTGIYTLTASAHAMNSKAVRVIRAVISLESSFNKDYRTLYWNENVPDYGSVMQ
jgi:general secretion pathway protein K